MEKLIVTNFLNIKHIELDLGKINILIGPQAQGKSVVAKLVYFFKISIIDFIRLYLIDNEEEIKENLLNNFRTIFTTIYWLHQDFEISYFDGDFEIIIKHKKELNGEQIILEKNFDFLKEHKKIKKEYSNTDREIQRLARDIEELQKKLYITKPFSETPFLTKQKESYMLENLIIEKRHIYEALLKETNKIEAVIKNLFKDRNLYVPSGRSFYSFLKENIFSLVNNFQFEYFIKAFGNIYNRSSTKYEYLNRHHQKNYDPRIDRLTEKILKGQYIYEQDIDFIVSSDGRKIRLNDASSGQQEALPIIVLLTVFALSNDDCYFFIEEPEAHLFPEAQNDIVNLMSLIFNITEKRHNFFITTHSPYILTAFNTIIQANNTYKRIVEEHREEQLPELFRIVPKDQIIDLEDVRVYSLQNGEIESSINTENQLIDANVIDEISNCTGEQFDQLLNLEFNNE